MTIPKTDEPVLFATQIRPLFRQKDIQSMRYHFDLGSYDDVSTYADRILQRLQAGTMPCDGAWPADQVEVFERWIRTGKRA